MWIWQVAGPEDSGQGCDYVHAATIVRTAEDLNMSASRMAQEQAHVSEPRALSASLTYAPAGGGRGEARWWSAADRSNTGGGTAHREVGAGCFWPDLQPARLDQKALQGAVSAEACSIPDNQEAVIAENEVVAL